MGSIRAIKKENSKISYKLAQKYQNAISNIFCYVRADLNSIDAERAIYDILVKLEEEYDKGINLDDYTADLKNFIEPFLEKYKKNKGYKFFSLLYDYIPIGVYGISFCIVIDMIFKILKSNERTFENMAKVNYVLKPSLYVAALIIFLFVMITIKNITKIWLSHKKNSAIIANVVSCLVLSLAIGAVAFFLNKNGVFNIISFTVMKSFIAVLIAVVIIFILSVFFAYRLRKK